MKDNHDMADLSKISADVAAAFSTIEEAGKELQQIPSLTRKQARELAGLRRKLRRLHADAWEWADDLTQDDGEITTMGGST